MIIVVDTTKANGSASKYVCNCQLLKRLVRLLKFIGVTAQAQGAILINLYLRSEGLRLSRLSPKYLAVFILIT